MDKTIDELFSIAKDIYNLYQKSINTQNAKEKKLFFELLRYLIKKENLKLKELQSWDYDSLLDKEESLMDNLGINSLDVIENYSEINRKMLPYLRILMKIDNIICKKEDQYRASVDLNGVYNGVDYPAFYDSLVLENIARFINTVEEEKRENCFLCVESNSKKQALHNEKIVNKMLESIRYLPYDMIYLNETLEKFYVNEYQANLSWKLFNILNDDKNKLDWETRIESLNSYNMTLALYELDQLTLPGKTRTVKAAYIRCLYLNSLLEGIEIDTFNDFISGNIESILDLKFPFMVVKRLQAIAKKFLEDQELLQVIEEQSLEEAQIKKIKQNTKK